MKRLWYYWRYRITGRVPPLETIVIEIEPYTYTRPGWKAFKAVAVRFRGDEHGFETVALLRARHPEYEQFFKTVDAA